VSTSQKVLLGVLVLIVALFVTSTATGGRNGQGDARSGNGGLVGLLHHGVGGASTVPRKDVDAPGCPPDTNGVLTVKGSCALHVGKASSTRQLKLRAGAVPLTVTAPVPRQDYTEDKDVDAGAEIDVAIDTKGADVTVACRGGPQQQQCPVTVLEGS
jgi:hypothetical protein